MARETVAQRRARVEAEVKAREEAQRKEYPSRLMQALERATTSFNYELRVQEGLFVLMDRDAEYEWERQSELSYSWTEASMQALEQLEDNLDNKAAERAERERRRTVKAEAERKVRELLSEEERELLGL